MTNDRVLINDAFENVKAEVEKALSSSPSIIKSYTHYLSLARGKFIRAYALLTCSLDSDNKINTDAVKLATAVELLHLATLVHDDVIDNADTRRGIDTLQKRFGKRTAVICGDYLFCLAIKKASEISDQSKFKKLDLALYMEKICLGELNQHINNNNIDLSMRQYLKIISGKTAALFEASCYGGACVGGFDNSELKKYKRFGRYLGMIFQLTDDCIDFEETKANAKKPVQSDYEQGVITLPLIYAFSQKDQLKSKAKAKRLSREEINASVASSGGLKLTRLLSQRYYKKAALIIDDLNADKSKKNILMEVLDKAFYGLQGKKT
ncbi:MAG: polyprenyl synthetase family protein [Eubacteriales bacterium]|jgi:heptaprenyl diphosphate synthase|nr:polyprenyl synthetase family protein [Eubacteriales bacterium]